MEKKQVINVYCSESASPEVLDVINIEHCRGKECELFLVNDFYLFLVL